MQRKRFDDINLQINSMYAVETGCWYDGRLLVFRWIIQKPVLGAETGKEYRTLPASNIDMECHIESLRQQSFF